MAGKAIFGSAQPHSRAGFSHPASKQMLAPKRKSNKPNNGIASLAFASKPTTTVVVTVKTVQKPRVPPTPVKVAAATTTSSAASTSSTSSPVPSKPVKPTQKRKRTDTPEVKTEAPAKSKVRKVDRDVSGSPAPRLARPHRAVPPFGTLEKPIARPCVSTLDGNVPHITSEDIVMRINLEANSGKKGKVGYKACSYLVNYIQNPFSTLMRVLYTSQTSEIPTMRMTKPLNLATPLQLLNWSTLITELRKGNFDDFRSIAVMLIRS